MSRNRLIMGKHCLEEVVKSQPERIIMVYTTKEKQNEPFLKGLPVRFKNKHELNQMVKSESHQSYIAEVHEKHSLSLKDFLEQNDEKEKCTILALDSINDPQNLGTLIRAAECFGIDAVLFSKNRGSDITPVATKASVGGTELVEIIKVSNLAESVKKCKEWLYSVIAADATKDAHSLYTYQFPDKFVLIMGSEGKGIQQLIRRNVDDVVSIPMEGSIDSLNVSQATSVILSHWKRAS